MNKNNLFHEHQLFPPILRFGVLVMDLLVSIAVVFTVLPRLKQGMSVVIFLSVIFPVAVAGIVTALAWMMKLIVNVSKEGIQIRFVPFVNRKIIFSEIKNARLVTYHPIKEYGGWGIRMGANGQMAYNTSGNRGVQLELQNNKQVLIGSQKPDEFLKIINSYK